MRAIRMAGEGPLRVVVSHEEITALKLTEEELRESREQLEEQKQSLEEANIALKVLLKQRESDREELEQRFISNVKDLVMPYVEKLRRSDLRPREKTLAEIVETHLDDIVNPLLQHLANANILMTPQEIQVAALVKDGKPSKEIADILNVSVTTVHFHRKNLRRKFGISNQRTNLRTFLLARS
jgi:DNA-binding CsgD family transcriptional regulator